MKTPLKTGLVLSIVFLLGFTVGTNDDAVKVKDVLKAQKVFGVDFSKTEADTMLNYLNRNLSGYDSMRAYSNNLGNDITPALYFDPIPSGFVINQDQKEIKWNIPADVELPENKEEVVFFTVPQLASLLKNKKITSVELTQLYLDRIDRFDDELKAVISVTKELGMSQARKADAEIKAGLYKGPLHGIPYGIKDLFTVKGYKTTWGAEPYKDQQFDYDATIVTKLQEAGAVLIAKLTSGALARGDVWFGGKTRNPWDTQQGASGSSAGSGSATSAGLVGFSIGTETLGSIISPSTRNGVTGLRPTFGAVSRYGGMPLSWSMDKPGPICRSTLGCAIVFDAIRGVDNRDKTVQNVAFNYNEIGDLSQLKIGYLANLFENDSSDNSDNNAATLDVFRSLGAELKEVKLPESIPYNAFDIILRAEAGAFFEELVRTKKDRSMVQQHKGSRANSLRQSRFIPAVEYLQANRHRTVLIEEMHKIMSEIDVLISPTFGFRQMLITNLTGHPAISIPNGFNEESHPTSVTLVGNLFDEASILAVAKVFQENTDFDEKRPPKFDVDN